MSQRNRPCPCGSGKRFKHCCGALGAASAAATAAEPPVESSIFDDMGTYLEPYRGRAMIERCGDMPPGRAEPLDWAPPGLLVVPGYLDATRCDAWRAYLSRQPARHSMIKDIDPETGNAVQRLDPQRVTQVVTPGDLKSDIEKALITAYRETITPHYGQQLDWMEPPGVLKYVPGGKYDGHADSEYWDTERRCWTRSIDRDFSLLLYLNDDFEGGGLWFPNFDVRVRPSKGMLIAFPSDHRYLHAAEPVNAGERFVLVGWATVKGSPRVTSTPMGVFWA